MREALERAAAESGRSLAQEIEWRLARSFEAEKSWGSEQTELAVRILSTTILFLEKTSGETWLESLSVRNAVKGA
jgi:hypothetical protein